MSKTFEINHQVGIKTDPKSLYKALTDPKTLAQWWTSDTRGKGAKEGDILEFWFGDFCQKFKVKKLKPQEFVIWKAQKDGMDEWSPTEIRLKISKDADQTWLRFKHSGWKENSDFLAHCSTKWAVFMLSLKNLLETGKGQPAPHDIAINYD